MHRRAVQTTGGGARRIDFVEPRGGPGGRDGASPSSTKIFEAIELAAARMRGEQPVVPPITSEVARD